MKTLIFSLLSLFFVLQSCKNDDDNNCQGIECLPPVTQTGEGTFGCLVNGEPFIDNSGFFNCFYQLVDGEYYFGISAEDNVEGIRQIFIGSNESQIELSNIINLNPDISGNFYGGLNINNLGGTLRTNDLGGTIIFNEFTTNPNVVSATFEFTITNPNTGITYEITEGRFDAQFTQ